MLEDLEKKKLEEAQKRANVRDNKGENSYRLARVEAATAQAEKEKFEKQFNDRLKAKHLQKQESVRSVNSEQDSQTSAPSTARHSAPSTSRSYTWAFSCRSDADDAFRESRQALSTRDRGIAMLKRAVTAVKEVRHLRRRLAKYLKAEREKRLRLLRLKLAQRLYVYRRCRPVISQFTHRLQSTSQARPKVGASRPH